MTCERSCMSWSSEDTRWWPSTRRSPKWRQQTGRVTLAKSDWHLRHQKQRLVPQKLSSLAHETICTATHVHLILATGVLNRQLPCRTPRPIPLVADDQGIPEATTSYQHLIPPEYLQQRQLTQLKRLTLVTDLEAAAGVLAPGHSLRQGLGYDLVAIKTASSQVFKRVRYLVYMTHRPQMQSHYHILSCTSEC